MRPWPGFACVLLAACGGGGGGVAPLPSQPSAQFAIDALDLPASQSRGSVAVRLLHVPPGPAPVLLEADVVFDDTAVRLATDLVPLTALLNRPQLDGGTVNGRFHLLYGDGTNRAPLNLVEGALFQCNLVAATPRRTGTYALELQNLRLVAADGSYVAVDPAPIRGAITIR